MGLAPRETAPGREVKDEYDPSISRNTQDFRVGSGDTYENEHATIVLVHRSTMP